MFFVLLIAHAHHLNNLRDLDLHIRLSMEAILGCPINDSSKLQVSLPVSMGGFSLWYSEYHSSASYLASINFSNNTIVQLCPPNLASPLKLSATLHFLQVSQPHMEEADITLSTQKALSHSVDLHIQNKLSSMDHSVQAPEHSHGGHR